MAMEYINYIKAKAHTSTAHKSELPVLSEEDELFLNRITADETPPPLPKRPQVMDLPVAGFTQGKDAQIALMDGAQNIPLPETPNEVAEEPLLIAEPSEVEESSAMTWAERRQQTAKQTWSWIRRDSRDSKRNATAAGLQDIADNLKSADAKPNGDHQVGNHEARKEEEDMTIVLERLNLAAVNNRVFSISDETTELLHKFNLVFRDLVNGVPTAYDDLESLLTNGDRQLQKTFNSLPSFLQKLIEQLPEKFTKGFGPEIMAVAAERAGRTGFNMQNAGKAAGAAQKMGFKTPALKDLIGKPGAIAGLMRSIITFLRARFPAFMGMNVLWSLALFVLLFVFWYCHKRGKEERLKKERLLTEQEVTRLEKEYAKMEPSSFTTTTAPEGASMEEIVAGMNGAHETNGEAVEVR